MSPRLKAAIEKLREEAGYRFNWHEDLVEAAGEILAAYDAEMSDDASFYNLELKIKALEHIINKIIEHEMSQSSEDGSMAYSGSYALRCRALLDAKLYDLILEDCPRGQGPRGDFCALSDEQIAERKQDRIDRDEYYRAKFYKNLKDNK